MDYLSKKKPDKAKKSPVGKSGLAEAFECRRDPSQFSVSLGRLPRPRK